ncbi:hypothetical protein ABFS83_08G120400 [Erythranthe nasuta]
MKMNLMVVVLVSFIFGASSAAAATSVAETPSPAPAPSAPEYVNLTQLLSVAGPFSTFLNYLQTTKLIDTFQNQANNTEEGITIFVPKDQAFSKPRASLSNLTQEQLKNLILFHALPHYYTLSDFKNLSHQNPIITFAGGPFSLNFTDNSGTIRIDSGWTSTKITSAVHAADPVAIYEIDRVLLPEAIFGTDIPPTPAPAPAPETPDADTKGGSDDSSLSPKASAGKSTSNSHKVMLNLGVLVSAVPLLSLLLW